ncbi:uncharacterized protein LOC125235594 [Leguminivora glycinivorella]|uniref:uncharacterized protein LOC125235594 n=1 Tax=Leguminivora glycinivorella TaxID=1035111 RepID=UPI0020105C32|nr:uncharacterized protein LOC125235594 [Leguminivora glycinivorella]
MSDDIDEDVPQLLQQWGLPQYIHTFKVNDITISTLSMIDRSLAKELIPSIGDRAKFLKNLDNWNKLTNPEESLEISSCSSDPPVFVDMLNPKHKQIKSVSEFLTPLDKNNTSTQLNDSNVIILPITGEDEEAGTSADLDMTICNEDVDVCSPLKSLLLKSNEGRGLLNLYSEQGKLSNNGRRKVCNIIIKDLMQSDPNKRIDSSLLLTKAQEIKEVFKKENISTYFIPYINDTKLKIKRCAKGKLYDCLQNRRRELREAKVIKKKNCSNIDNNSNEPLEVVEQDGGADEDILWLQNCTEPWHTVIEKWHKTSKNRLKEIETSEMTIGAYINKYPVLKTPRGHELLIEDFEFLYPLSGNKLFEIFPTIKKNIFKLALSKSQVTEVKEILEQLQLLNKDDENYEEIESILAFMLLPLLLGNPSHRTKKQVWRPSKAEVKDGFVTHVLRPMDVQDAIAHRREKYLKYKLTLQPVIVIVGSSYMDIQKYYVVVNDLFYETNSILKAVDTCFKIFHSLHCQYPTESVCVWNFLQLGLYQLKTKWDKTYSTVNAFITDLDIDL